MFGGLVMWLGAACVGRSVTGVVPGDATTDLGLTDASVGERPSGDVPRVPGGGGFDPRAHGFSFANYNNAAATNLTPAEMMRLFGRSVCEPSDAGACALTPVAQEWMDEQNRSMDIGHCEGMATLATLLHQGTFPVADFQPGATNAFALTRSPRLEREIALWWTTQTVSDLLTEDCPPAAQTVEALERSFRQGSGEAYVLALWTLVNGEQEGGHAVTPIAIERSADGGANQASVLLYDNNFPGETRRLRYTDLATGAWTYQTSQNPDAATATYVGDDRANRLCLRHISARLAQPTRCYFCNDFRSPALAMNDPGGRVLRAPENIMGAATMTVANAAARTGGVVARMRARLGSLLRVTLTDNVGRTMNGTGGGADGGIPGARAIRLTSIEPGDVRVEPRYVFPEGAPVRVTVQNASADPTMMESLDAQFFGPGYALSVEGIDLPPGQSDLITLAPVGAGMLYQTSRAESADVVVAVTLEGADLRFRLRTSEHAGGETIGVALDTNHRVLEFYFVGAATEMHTFSLYVERTSPSGVEVFEHASEVEPGGSFFQLYYGDWAGDGHPIPLGRDTNDDGTPEMMEMLPDEGSDAGAATDAGR